MALALLLSLSLVQAPAQDAPPLLTAPAFRRGYTRAELVLLGDPWPEAVARAVRFSGSGERSKDELEAFLVERNGAYAVRAREFGVEITIEAPDDRFEEVLAALRPGLSAPALTPEALQVATMELVLTRVPGEFDPLEHFDRRLAALIDPDVEPPPVLEIDLGVLFGGDDGDGDEGDGDPGGGPPPIPGLEPLDPEQLADAWARLGRAGLAGRLSSHDLEAHRPGVEALLRQLDRRAGPAAVQAAVTERDLRAATTAASLSSFVPDAMTPTDLVGFATPFPQAEGCSDADLDLLRRAVAAQVAEWLPVRAGTAPAVKVRRRGEGVPSLRVTALVEPVPAEAWADLAGRRLRLDAEALESTPDGPGGVDRSSAPLVSLALGRD
ncbi:MAG: hypothetical protein AAFZ65_20135, partial [Planctomycetota bacterium]